MGSAFSRRKGPKSHKIKDLDLLASETPFTWNEVEALYELYKKLSTSVVNDGFIQKEEFQLALFRNSNKQNLFTDRIFSLFDVNHNGHIDFREFVRSLSFIIQKPLKLINVVQTGYIEHGELKEMVLALLTESDLTLSDDVIEAIVNKTFAEVDTKGDGRIDQEEWRVYVGKNPSLLKNMTLPYLMDITLGFPSFVVNKNAEDTEL